MAESSIAKRGRRPGFVMGEEHRLKITNSNILNALIEHVEGKRKMGATQVTAGIALLRKVMPDLSAVELAGSGDGPAIRMVITGVPRADDPA
jgi:hypothetical protein